MNIDIISVLPELMQSFVAHSIVKRAQDKGLLNLRLIGLRNYGKGNYNQIDDYSYGGDAGMVILCEPLAQCIEELQAETNYDEIIFLTPDGETYHQQMANQLSLSKNLLLICGHYKGIDERIREKYVTKEISIGDYVLSGGELGAAILVDSIGRLIPGVLNNESSALFDSHQDGLLAPPVYSRPEVWRDMPVPKVLLSGDPKKIDAWKQEISYSRTQKRRPDLLED